jgi:hypothetical protein
MEEYNEANREVLYATQNRVTERLEKELQRAIAAKEQDYRSDTTLYHGETKTNIDNAMKALFKEVNHMGSDEEVVDNMFLAIVNEHRTLQQGFIGAMFKVLSMYSKAPFDLRNEDSVRVCRKMAEVMKDDLYFRFI